MTFLEKQTDPTTPMHWRGDMQADYLYPNGVAGDRFFKHLKRKDTFLASRCPQCNKIFLPPRLFCEDCFIEIPEHDWKEVPPRGTIRLFTVVTIDCHGQKLPEPMIIAFIDIEKTDGALLGVINVRDPTNIKDITGRKVKAVLRPKSKREGTLKDILHFELMK